MDKLIAINVSVNKFSGGYTVVELLTVMLLVAILFASAAPSFRQLVLNAKLESTIERLNGALKLAQSTAARSGRQSFVCASTNGTTCSGSNNWTEGWLVFEQTDSGNSLILVEQQQPEEITLTASDFANLDRITFTPLGNITDLSAPGAFLACDGRGREKAKGTIVTSTGLIRHAQDTNSNQIIEGPSGGDIAPC